MTETVNTNAHLLAVAESLASIMEKEHGVRPKVEPCYENIIRLIYQKDGERCGVSLHWDSYRKRISPSGIYPVRDRGEYSPHQYHSSDKPVTVNVSDSRDPHGAAKDIARRFLPSYWKAWEGMKQRAEADDAYNNNRQQTVIKLQEVGADTRLTSGGDVRFSAPGSIYGTVYDGSVRFDAMTVSADVALKILAIIQESRQD